MESWIGALTQLAGKAATPGFLAAVVHRTGTVVLVLVLSSVGYGLLTRLLRRTLTPNSGAAHYERKLQRAQTMVPLLRSIARYVISFVAGVAILQQFGIGATAVVASAGVVGLAVGFGAQSLVRDLISGLFLLFEGFIAVGDVATIGEHTGMVEAIGLRVTQLRKLNGELQPRARPPRSPGDDGLRGVRVRGASRRKGAAWGAMGSGAQLAPDHQSGV